MEVRDRDQIITVEDGLTESVEAFERTESEGGFAERPLTEQQRKELGIDGYYPPFRADKCAVMDSRRLFWAGKRVFDVLSASLALIVLSPVILVALLAVYIEDPTGSPVFVQRRVGRGGREFSFIKIRSMYTGSEKRLDELLKDNQAQGKAFKMKDDPRITKVGKIIRNTSVDELLQLINIIRGDMSVVGPRPPLPREVESYNDYEKQRLIVTPGLTCFWQVYPRRHEISFDDWVAMDLKYVVERNWRTDIRLIFMTVARVLKGNTD